MTVVMVTHERTLAERFARRMVSMADGKLARDELNSGVSLADALTERSV
jgi:ABC-type ATPase involved in cell division